MFVSCVCCLSSGLCDELITRPGESYRICVCLIVCNLKTSTNVRPKPDLGRCTRKNSAQATILCTVLPKICGTSARILHYVTLPTPRTSGWLLHFLANFWFPDLALCLQAGTVTMYTWIKNHKLLSTFCMLSSE